MRRSLYILSLTIAIAACSGPKTEIKRLSPLLETSTPPAQCRIASVLPNSPASKNGIVPGDAVQSINGKTPGDASQLVDLVSQSTPDAQLVLATASGTSRSVTVRLNDSRPRLGAVCDLTGWRKTGLTAAGNVSLSVFDGPYAFTASGILDKGLAFLRVRVTNNSDSTITLGPDQFTAVDGNGAAAAILSPRQVMCLLYGEKGAHLLALKKQKKEQLDVDGIAQQRTLPDDHCTGVSGRLSGGDPHYAEANAEYVAAESLWVSTYTAGGVADGLVYLTEPTLPVTITATLAGRSMSVQLGLPKASVVEMKQSDLGRFFEQQKKGTSLRLTLRKGRVFVGRFSSYDAIDEKIWFDSPSGGMLRSTSFPLSSVKSAELLEQMPAKPVASENAN